MYMQTVKRGQRFIYNNSNSLLKGVIVEVKAAGAKRVILEPVNYTMLWSGSSYTVAEVADMLERNILIPVNA